MARLKSRSEKIPAILATYDHVRWEREARKDGRPSPWSGGSHEQWLRSLALDLWVEALESAGVNEPDLLEIRSRELVKEFQRRLTEEDARR